MKPSWKNALAAGLVLFAASAALPFFGGFGVSLTLPAGASAKIEGAVLVVQPIGCNGPGASLTARAEGLDQGLRRSIPLTLVPLPNQSSAAAGEAYVLKRQWPQTGTWVLVFEARNHGMAANALLKLDPSGAVPVVDRTTLSAGKPKTLADRKTTLTTWSFTSDPKVVPMQVVGGNLTLAINHSLQSSR